MSAWCPAPPGHGHPIAGNEASEAILECAYRDDKRIRPIRSDGGVRLIPGVGAISQGMDIDFTSLPKQQGYTIDIEELENFELHPDADEYEHSEEDTPEPKLSARMFEGNEVKAAWIEADPGEAIPWHTHDPDQYQLLFPFQGRVKVSYIDNDGSEHETEAEAMTMVYLPSGAHNRIEAVGEESLKLLAIERKTAVSRVEQVIAEVPGVYDEKDASSALNLDTLRGVVHDIDEDVVSPY